MVRWPRPDPRTRQPLNRRLVGCRATAGSGAVAVTVGVGEWVAGAAEHADRRWQRVSDVAPAGAAGFWRASGRGNATHRRGEFAGGGMPPPLAHPGHGPGGGAGGRVARG